MKKKTIFFVIVIFSMLSFAYGGVDKLFAANTDNIITDFFSSISSLFGNARVVFEVFNFIFSGVHSFFKSIGEGISFVVDNAEKLFRFRLPDIIRPLPFLPF